MPRQIDLTPQNLKVGYNPNNQLSVTVDQINNLFANLPQLTLQAIEDAIKQLLGFIDQVTGLNFLGFAENLQAIFGIGGDILEQLIENIPFIGPFIAALGGTGAALSDLVAAIHLLPQEIIDKIANALGHAGLGFLPADVATFIEDDVVTPLGAAVSNITALITGLGGTAMSDVVTLISDLKTIIDTLLAAFTGGGISDVIAAIQGAVSDIADMLTSAGGLTAHNFGLGVANVISGLAADVANLQTLLNNLWDGFNGTTGSSGKSLSDVLGKAQALLTNLNGRALQSDVQAFLDAVANALGHTGTGHTAANILSYMGAIPGTVISGITSIEQDIIDKACNALGVTGTGHSTANLLTALENIPGGNIIGAILAADQDLRDAIANAFGHTGSGHTLSDVLGYLGSIPGSVISGITAIEQETRDKIANAMGHSGTGHTAADILSYLSAIPATVIANVLGGASLAADVQAIVDKVANGLGQSGTGHTLANLVTYLGSIPSGNVANVLGGSNLGADVQAIVDKISNGLGQSGTGHTLANLLTYLGAIPGSNLAGSIAASLISGVTTNEQAIADAVYQAIHGGATTGNAISTIKTGLQAIPSANLAAVLGSANLGADLQAVVDKISNALGQAGTGHTLANLLSYLGAIPGSNLTGSVAAALISGTLATGNIPNVTKAMSTDLQATIDAIHQAVLGGSSTGNSTADVKTQIQAIFTNLFGTSTLGTVLATGAVPNITRTMSTDLQSAIDGFNQAINNIGTTGAAATTVKTNINNFLTGVLNGLTGGNYTATTYSGVQTAAAGVKATGTTNSANAGGTTGLSVNSFNQALQRSAVGSGGLVEQVSFSGYANASGVPSPFTGATYLTTTVGALYAISGGVLTYGPSTGVQAQIAYYATPTVSDYQVVSAVYSAANDNGPSALAGNNLIGRMNLAATTYVEAIFSAGSVQLQFVVSNSNAGGPSTVSHTIVPGALYELVLGDPSTSSPYKMQVLCNGVPIITYNDTGHASTVGSSNRLAGMVSACSASGLNAASVASWGVRDNAPAPAQIGSGFRQYRAATGSVSVASGNALIANSFFDTNQYVTTDYTNAPATNNKLTVSVAGFYIVHICLLVGANTTNIAPILYQNGSIIRWGGSFTSTGLSDSSFIVYCNAGDYLQPGTHAAATGASVTGEATGVECYWEVTLANCGTLS